MKSPSSGKGKADTSNCRERTGSDKKHLLFYPQNELCSVTKTFGPTEEQGICGISRQLMLARAMCLSHCPFDPLKRELKGEGTWSEPRSG